MKIVFRFLLVLAAAAVSCSAQAAKEDKSLALGAKAIDFSLPGVDGKTHSIETYKDKDVLVVIFTCNHCPVAKAYQDRIIAIQKDYGDKGVQVVGINPNSTKVAPSDSFEHMKTRAKEKGYNFPYLRDKSQEVAKAYGATCTPHVFVFDKERVLRYRGRIDDNWRDPDKVEHKDLRNAIEALLAGKKVPKPDTLQFGCSIKWDGK
jgi:peroxiredoxin